MLTGRKLRLVLAFAVLVVLAFGASCKGFFPKPTLTSIAVGPANPTIPVTTGTPPVFSTKQFTAVGTFDNGNPGPTPVTWSATGVATIDSSSGLATAQAVGTATITATSTINPTIANNTTLTVVPPNITSITLSGACGQTGLTQSKGFELKATDQGGNDISPFISTWTFTAHVSGTTETGFTLGTPDAGGQPFTGLWNPAPTGFPFLVDAVASLKIGTSTISSTNACQLSFSS
jgi:hypothetical protein